MARNFASGIKWAEHETNHPCVSQVKVKDAWAVPTLPVCPYGELRHGDNFTFIHICN